MREVMRGYRLKVKLIEEQAQEAVEKVFLWPMLDNKTLAGIPGQVIAEIRPAVNLALSEGVKFGAYIKSQVK